MILVVITLFVACVQTGNAEKLHQLHTTVNYKHPINDGRRIKGIYPLETVVYDHGFKGLENVNQNVQNTHNEGVGSVDELWNKEDSKTFNNKATSRYKRRANTESSKSGLIYQKYSNDKTRNVDENSEGANQTYFIDILSSSENQYNSSWPIYAVLIRYRGDVNATRPMNDTLEKLADGAFRNKRQSNDGGMEFAYKENNSKEHQKKNASKSQTSTYQENLEEEYSKEHSNHDYNGKVQNISNVKGDKSPGDPGNEVKKNETTTPKGEVVFPPTMFWCQCPQTKPENDGSKGEPKGDGPVIVSGSLQKMFSFGIGGQLGIQFRKPKWN